MEPNLYEGDYIVVTKFSYGWSHFSIPLSPPIFSGRVFEKPAQRGDIAVFKTPAGKHIDLIKRVIGLPGDRIQMAGPALHQRQAGAACAGTVKEDVGEGYVRVARFRETRRTALHHQRLNHGQLTTPTLPGPRTTMMGQRDNSRRPGRAKPVVSVICPPEPVGPAQSC